MIDLDKPLRIAGTHEPVAVLMKEYRNWRSDLRPLISWPSVGHDNLAVVNDNCGWDGTLSTLTGLPLSARVENAPPPPRKATRYRAAFYDDREIYTARFVYKTPEDAEKENASNPRFLGVYAEELDESKLIRRPS